MLLLISCKKEHEVHGMKKIDRFDNITLIFTKAPKSKFISLRENPTIGGRTYFKNIASYRDTDGIVRVINPNRESQPDTISLSIQDEYTEIYFERIGLEGYSFLFKNGDTISVHYKHGNPQVQVLNRETKKFDYQFESFKNEHISNLDMTSFEQFFRYVHLPNNINDLTKNEIIRFADNKKRTLSEKLIEDLKDQKKKIDSIHALGLISKNIYTYNLQKLEYINLSVLGNLKELPFHESPSKNFEASYASMSSNLLMGNNPDKIDVSTSIKKGNSLLRFRFYYDFLMNSFLPNYVEKKSNKFSFNYGNFGGNYYDWAKVYDHIKVSDLYPDKVKDLLLYRYMSKISKDMSPEIVKRYYSDFKYNSTNSAYLDLLNSEYNLEGIKTDKLTLKDKFDTITYLEDILEENRGKVILVDFWASWCQPCIEDLPYKKKLRESYNNDKVLFISIAIDKDFSKWSSFKTEDDEMSLSHNYILTNPLMSKLIKENHIRYIPRYLIFDRNGELAIQNSPRASSEKINHLIEELIQKKKLEKVATLY